MKHSSVRGPGTRERIVSTAAGLFYAHGIHAVGVDRVALEAGVAKPTLYQHFSSKDELVAACLHEHSTQWKGSMSTAVDRRGTGIERTAAVFDVLGRGYSSPGYRGCPFINAAAEYPDSNGPVAEAITSHRADVRALFVLLLADLPGPIRRQLASQLVLLYDGAMIGAQHGDGARIARVARQAARQLINERLSGATHSTARRSRVACSPTPPSSE